MIEMVLACFAYGIGVALSYFAGRTWHDAVRFTNAENEVREQFNLSSYPTKYKEYPEGYAQALEERLGEIAFPSLLAKRSLKSDIKKAYSKTRKRSIDDPNGL
jgi:hypothetical protein